LDHYGAQHWWPGDTPFEVMVGAVLTQNTAWTNVERAIENLKKNKALDPEVILDTGSKELAEWLKPSGYFNVKAERLKHFCQWYVGRGGLNGLKGWHLHDLRADILGVKGIGPETADDILLYALDHPVFVIDAYTRRLFSRLGLVKGDEGYEQLRFKFEAELERDVALFNEYHALIVIHAKDTCRKRVPRCEACCLEDGCRFSKTKD